MEEENPPQKSALRSAVTTGCCMWTPIAQSVGDSVHSADVIRTARPGTPATSAQSVAPAPSLSGTKND